MIQLYKERCGYADYIIYNTVSSLDCEFFSIDELFTDKHGVLFIKHNTWDEPLAVLDSWYIESVDNLGVVSTFEEFDSVAPKKPSSARCYINEGKLVTEPLHGLDYTIYPTEESGSLNDFLTDLSERYDIHSEVLFSTPDEQEMVKFIEDIVFLEELEK